MKSSDCTGIVHLFVSCMCDILNCCVEFYDCYNFSIMSRKRFRSQKLKVDGKCRDCQSKWEIAYFFIERQGKQLCLICNQIVVVYKVFSSKKHYNINHKSKFDCNTKKMRMDTLLSLKSKLQGQQLMFTKANTESKDALKTNCIKAIEIAKRSKLFTDGDFIKLQSILIIITTNTVSDINELVKNKRS